MNTPDTWGIPSHSFLVFYCALAVVAILLVLADRFDWFRATPHDTGIDLSPAEIGLLRSDRHAVLAAIAQLRMADLVDSTGRPVPGPSPAKRHDVDWFARSVLDTLSSDRRGGRHELAATVTELRSGLVDRGYVRRLRIPVGVLIILPVFVLGLVRMVAGLLNGKPVGYLAIVCFLLLLVMAVLSKLGQRLTPRGRAALAALRREHRLLAPDLHPSLRTYGTHRSAIATALFGSAALALIDPMLAASSAFGIASTSSFRTLSAGSCSSGGGGCGGGGCGGCGGGGGGGGGGCGG